MGNIAKMPQIGERMIKALEQMANDPNRTPAQRKRSAKQLAEWKAAREA